MFVEEKAPGEVEVKPLDTVSKLLLKAAAALEAEGWTQGALIRQGAKCANGALWYSAGCPVGKERDHFQALDDYRGAKHRLEEVVGLIPAWNDAPDRTKDEVVAKLRAVALGG